MSYLLFHLLDLRLDRGEIVPRNESEAVSEGDDA